nr:MAG TPA: Morphogenesis protein 1 wall, phi29, hydrolase, infection [Caudoviricetes sp.]
MGKMKEKRKNNRKDTPIFVRKTNNVKKTKKEKKYEKLKVDYLKEYGNYIFDDETIKLIEDTFGISDVYSVVKVLYKIIHVVYKNSDFETYDIKEEFYNNYLFSSYVTQLTKYKYLKYLLKISNNTDGIIHEKILAYIEYLKSELSTFKLREVPDNAKTIWNFLNEKEYTPSASAGILGNIQQESSIDNNDKQNNDEFSTVVELSENAEISNPEETSKEKSAILDYDPKSMLTIRDLMKILDMKREPVRNRLKTLQINQFRVKRGTKASVIAISKKDLPKVDLPKFNYDSCKYITLSEASKSENVSIELIVTVTRALGFSFVLVNKTSRFYSIGLKINDWTSVQAHLLSGRKATIISRDDR